MKRMYMGKKDTRFGIAGQTGHGFPPLDKGLGSSEKKTDRQIFGTHSKC